MTTTDYSNGKSTWYYAYIGTGSVSNLTDSHGTLTASYRYHPGGAASVIETVAAGNPFDYNGEYTDAATKDQYLRARYYDPHSGNFLTEDSYHGSQLEPLSQNLYTYAENNSINFSDPSGHGILSFIKKGANALGRGVSKAARYAADVARKAMDRFSPSAQTKDRIPGSSGSRSGGGSYGGSARSKSSGSYSGRPGQSNRPPTAYGRAKQSGKSSYNWSKPKVKEAKNIFQSWKKGLEKRAKKFCTTAKRMKKGAVEFVKNVDWKKVAIGVGTTLLVAGVVVATGGSAAPVLVGAAIGAGSGAVFSGGAAAIQGKSMSQIAKAASDGFMWGAIGGAVGGGTSSLLSKGINAGSKVARNPVVQRTTRTLTDTAVDFPERKRKMAKLQRKMWLPVWQ